MKRTTVSMSSITNDDQRIYKNYHGIDEGNGWIWSLNGKPVKDKSFCKLLSGIDDDWKAYRKLPPKYK